MEKKYTVLRVIATLYKIAGVLIALGTVLVVILIVVGGAASSGMMREYGLDSSGPLAIFLGIIATVLGGGLSALSVFAIGEALYLLIGLEENTRFTAIMLRDRLYPQPPMGQAPIPPQPMAPPVTPTYPQPQ